MANHLDLPRSEADVLNCLPKTAPTAGFRLIRRSAGHESWELAVGVLVEGGEFKKGLTIQLVCHQTKRPFRQSFKFSLFRLEYGEAKRSYQLDTTSMPIGDLGSHEWPHEHLGQDRLNFGSNFPSNFSDSVSHFCRATQTEFEDVLENPFEFRLRKS